MKRLMENTVFSGFVTCCRLAGTPTRRSPPCVKATTDGVVRPPSRLGITVGSPPSSTAMQELVVPRSIPIVLPIFSTSSGSEGTGGRSLVAINLSVLIAGLAAVAGRFREAERLPELQYRDSLDGDELVAGGQAPYDANAGSADPEAPGDQAAERLVRPPLDRGG